MMGYRSHPEQVHVKTTKYRLESVASQSIVIIMHLSTTRLGTGINPD